MSNQTVIYTELNLEKKSERQKIKDANASILNTDQELTYVELNLHTTSQNLQNNDRNLFCKGKLIAGVLGIICIVLMTSILTITIMFIIPSQKMLKNNNSETATTQPACSCGQCPDDWFYYSNNCYYISDEEKTWNVSRISCASKNSNLLHIDNTEEQNFIMSLSSLSWIGLFRESHHHMWHWINGTNYTTRMSDPGNNSYNCGTLTWYDVQPNRCGLSTTYICKRKIYRYKI
ncbi:PREDICTED: NKG2-A/NKG2-B type II integral membrane protein-like [Elephantulus edwardii]|uniref:NKG2-A/NKG2-B type II integral membrane protein-like n=1 Tax=Elephantulus edwardii TaxID=28737 RepID=UPI0003F081B8|nr:PREDICTED: NKG2-A/NKG2-B type II integral membrane protein-like [Elephantulus edwardii]